ncbi:hypothetical protein AtubIFM55763_005949 [Aspergillus tubingensis]|nr:hypothetical protein AtubIFM55763_005949 [Aspergillus tubingensis]
MSLKSEPLNILIVGAGLGGLFASLALRQDGHRAGAGIRIPPNSTRLLRRWGIDFDKMRKCLCRGYHFLRWEDGSTITKIEFEDMVPRHGEPYYLVHRADLHASLLGVAIEAGVVVHKNRHVTSYDFSVPMAITAESEKWMADLIICADGIKSTARPLLTSQPDRPRDTGDAAYRILIPGQDLLADPDLAGLITHPATTSWCGPDAHLVGYPIRDGELYNIVVCATSKGETTDETWVVEGDNEELCARFSGWEPRVQKLCRLTKSFMKWRLCDLPALSTWTHPSGKACLLGDSCHPMLPYLAQGAAQAAEDAATIRRALAEDTDITTALKRYERIRNPRASLIQSKTREHQYILHIDDGEEQCWRDELMRQDSPSSPIFWGYELRRGWLFSHDAEKMEEATAEPRFREAVLQCRGHADGLKL